MISITEIGALNRAKIIDRDGNRVGRVGQVFVSDDGTELLFVTVHIGLFGSNESLVPLRGAEFTDGELFVAYDKATINDAPTIRANGMIPGGDYGGIFNYYDGDGADSGWGTVPSRLIDGSATDSLDD